jgi:hypothetical protein
MMFTKTCEGQVYLFFNWQSRGLTFRIIYTTTKRMKSANENKIDLTRVYCSQRENVTLKFEKNRNCPVVQI